MLTVCAANLGFAIETYPTKVCRAYFARLFSGQVECSQEIKDIIITTGFISNSCKQIAVAPADKTSTKNVTPLNESKSEDQKAKGDKIKVLPKIKLKIQNVNELKTLKRKQDDTSNGAKIPDQMKLKPVQKKAKSSSNSKTEQSKSKGNIKKKVKTTEVTVSPHLMEMVNELNDKNKQTTAPPDFKKSKLDLESVKPSSSNDNSLPNPKTVPISPEQLQPVKSQSKSPNSKIDDSKIITPDQCVFDSDQIPYIKDEIIKQETTQVE